jgi:hypothetical protein
MTPEMIEKIVENAQRKNALVRIQFKDRNTVSGTFIQGVDYEELKPKNFWRIVNESNIQEWKQTKNINLSRLYNGASFTKISDQ